jgi:hypothetical protein
VVRHWKVQLLDHGSLRVIFVNGDGLWPLLTAFDGPVAVAVDSKGAVYVLDDIDRRVRKIH